MYKSKTPEYDQIPGNTVAIDSLYWDVESRHGNKYTVCVRDEGALFICGFHMRLRSEAKDKLRADTSCVSATPESRPQIIQKG